MAVDETKLATFSLKVIDDIGASINAALVVIGDRLGLYRAMVDAGPLTSAELAARTETSERCIREWLCAQAANAYVDYDAATERFALNPEQAAVFTDETSPVFFAGSFQIIASVFKDLEKIEAAFRHGTGIAWEERDSNLFAGVERFFSAGYEAHLVTEWLPALDGVEEKLQRGARVADIGCGAGRSTITMAKAYPRSRFIGFDLHAPSIVRAREVATAAGVSERTRFEIARAQEFSGDGYELITLFDCLHDMGDPVGAARQVRNALADDGTWLLVEPQAGDRMADNLNPISRIFYGASATICTHSALAQSGGYALGAQAGEARLHAIATEAGFMRWRRVAETPVYLAIEVRR